MHFAFLCKDKPGALQVRLDTRPEHLAYLNALNADGKLAFAGPFLGDDDRCTIYEDRPSACRAFECTRHFNQHGVGRHGIFLDANERVTRLLAEW